MASGNRVLEFLIRAKDAATHPIRSVRDAVKKLADGIKSAAARIGANLANIKAGFDILKGAASVVAGGVRRVWDAVVAAMQYESLEKKWSMLLGDAERAKRLVADMQKMGETPPFSREQFSAAAQSLNTFGGAALVSTRMLTDLGDTAYRTGNSIESVADVVGRAYAMIRDGQPLARMKMQLVNMGIVTPEVAASLDEMQKSGASATAQWDVLRQALARSSGAMDSAMQTGDGLRQALQGSWAGAVQEFGKAFLDLAKNEMGYLLSRLKELRESGAITEWAERAKRAVQPLVEIIGNLFEGGEVRRVTFEAAWDKLKSVLVWAWDSLRNVFDYGGAALYANIRKAIAPLWDRKGYLQQAGSLYSFRQGTINNQFRAANALADARIAQAAEERRRRAEERANEKSASASGTADAAREADEKAAEERMRSELAEAEEKAAREKREAEEKAAREKEINERQSARSYWEGRKTQNQSALDAMLDELDPDKWKRVLDDFDKAIEDATNNIEKHTLSEFGSEKEYRRREKEERRFEKRLRKVREKEANGGPLSRRDRAILDVGKARDKAIEDAKAAKAEAEARHKEALAKQDDLLKEQRAIHAALEDNFQELQKLSAVG